ncbi:hypothetical protein H2248_007210 [Termitomyces sp. 'cryptogamus']|nr:hypothetical protein H2248_007210 [Termitomyces sp. 'cryptogamus']
MIPESMEFFDDSMPLVFTHGDLGTANIRIGKGWHSLARRLGASDTGLAWPERWAEFVPSIAGSYEKQLAFLENNADGIAHSAFDRFDQ